jgi:hypothetical protein
MGTGVVMMTMMKVLVGWGDELKACMGTAVGTVLYTG